MAEPPLRITGALCVGVTLLLIGLIVRNALTDDEPLALAPVATNGETPTATATEGEAKPKDRSRHPVPEVDYAEKEDGAEGEQPASPDTGGGQRVEGGDGRSGGEQTFQVVKEGFSIRGPKQIKPKVGREGPTHYLTLSLDKQAEFLSIFTVTLYPWTDEGDLVERYQPYSEEPLKTPEGLDVDTQGNPWSRPDEQTIVIVRKERVHIIRAAGFGKDFPEQIALLNGLKLLEIPTHRERLKTQYKLTDEQLAAPASAEVKEKAAALVEQLGNIRGGLPAPVRRALEFENGGDYDQAGGLLLVEFLQVVADYVAQSMRKH